MPRCAATCLACGSSLNACSSKPIENVGAGEPVSSVIAALETADAAIVLDDGKPTGVVTRSDLLGFLAASH